MKKSFLNFIFPMITGVLVTSIAVLSLYFGINIILTYSPTSFYISIGLLILYAIVLWELLNLVKAWEVNDPEITISGGKLLILNGVGGLVSAVVIMTLGITKRGKVPTASVRELSKGSGETVMVIVIIAYVAVWLILGGLVVYHGVIESPDACSAINEYGKTWIGLLIGAGYAYFGINP